MTSIPPLVPAGASFSFGNSPFRVKGVLYRGTRSFFDRTVEGGYARLLDSLEPPELRAFMDQTFLASRTYDVMPVPALIVQEARLLGQSLEDYLFSRTRWQAQQDIHGVYKMLLRVATPGMVVSRIPRALIQMFSFPTVDIRQPEPHVLEADFHGIPEPLVPWLSVGFTVYAQTALELAGGRRVEVVIDRVDDEGAEAGLALRRMRMVASWSSR